MFSMLSIRSAVFGAGLALAAATVAPAPVSAHTWTELNPAGSIPEERTRASGVYDPATNRLMVFSGMQPQCCNARNDFWVLSNANGRDPVRPRWTRFAIGPRLTDNSAAYNTATNRMIVFGGANFHPEFNDVWIVTDANGAGAKPPAWTKLSVAGPLPHPRAHHAAGYDQQHNRLIVFGGASYPAVFNDVWVLSNADGSKTATPQWTQLTPTGPLPPPRYWPFSIYDPISNRMLIFGGSDYSGNLYNDVWVLMNANGLGKSPPAWKKVSVAGVPPSPRYGGAAGYNAAADRVVLFGGADGNYDAYTDTWLLKNAFSSRPRWVRRTPLGVAPQWGNLPTNAYDGAKDDLMVFGGASCTSDGCVTNKTFVLRNATK